jgi:protein-arginine kinase activator protein McsA
MSKCPISGNECHYLKTISIVDVENGKASKEIKVCYSCLSDCVGKELPIQKDKDTPDISELAEKIKEISHNLMHTSQPMVPLEAKEVPNKVCPNCGISLKKISQEGRLGCQMCYDWFRTELDVIIHHAHDGATKHVGKVPKKWNKEVTKKQKENDLGLEILGLEIELDAAILKEDYESAAALRDKIKELRSSLNEV